MLYCTTDVLYICNEKKTKEYKKKMKDKMKNTQNGGDGKESVYGEKEQTINYIKSVAFEKENISLIFSFIYFLYSFNKNSLIILFLKLSGKPVNSYFEAVKYFNMSLWFRECDSVCSKYSV